MLGGSSTVFPPLSCCRAVKEVGTSILSRSGGGNPRCCIVKERNERGKKNKERWQKSAGRIRKVPGFGALHLHEGGNQTPSCSPGSVITAGAPEAGMLILRCFKYIHIYIYKILSSPCGCVLKRGLGTMRINEQIEN